MTASFFVLHGAKPLTVLVDRLDVLAWSNPRRNGRGFGRFSRKRTRAGKHYRQALQTLRTPHDLDPVCVIQLSFKIASA